MKLVIASNNKHKIREIRQILAPWFADVCSMADAGLVIDVLEDGETFEENALKKAREVYVALGGTCAVLADDSGLVVDALFGAPGVHSARYANDQHDDEANNAKLLRALAGVPDAKRGGAFVSVVSLVRPGKAPLTARGECAGRIGHAPVGSGGFGYDPLFIVPELGKTFSELSGREKNAISHRGRALEALRAKLAGESL